jgi:ATP-dependent DNA helicase RecQ
VTLPDARQQLLSIIERHWGYTTFRPLQEEAMTASLGGRDSLVVMPTGGGKSLCYQVPALLREKTTVVVSPLISLMKDQVDGLVANGVVAAQLNSSQSYQEQRGLEQDLIDGKLKLLFVSPERLAVPAFRALLQRAGVQTFAIDEAHCISHWGHDFRPEYRQLRRLKEIFPGATVHAYTATATEPVRADIAQQLGLIEPLILVGGFDRPNLTYRILPRRDELAQAIEVIERHRGEPGIIYCMRRKDVDGLTGALNKQGFRALAYHAGLSQEERRKAQEAFINEQCDLVVATVAFGMGIDRSNVRFVLHMAMPKSIEHYQQETGRAGRDGLEAECVLLYSGSDAVVWKSLLDKSTETDEVDPQYLSSAYKHLTDLDRYCGGAICRHAALVRYFGQPYDGAACGACDICLGDTEELADAMVVAQKILSCVSRVGQAFGANHVISVLRGEDTEKIRDRNHDRLSTYGLLKGHGKNELRDWIYQLISQGFLTQVGDPYPVLRFTESSRSVLRGEAELRLLQPISREKQKSRKVPAAEAESWQGVDRGLFEELRKWRRSVAEERNVPPYVIFSDKTLRELAGMRPTTVERLRSVYGVGQAKEEAFGSDVVERIARYCDDHGLSHDHGESMSQASKRRPRRW